MKFAGLDGWIEFFRVGEHTDSAGVTRRWTEEDMETIVSKYDPAKHEAPVVIGHPEQDHPAYGWVEALKSEAGVLLGKLRQVVPEFADMVEKGLFKKRSIALYPDLRLKHVGFLGAAAPAVKGLADIKFREEQAVTIELAEDKKAAGRIVGAGVRDGEFTGNLSEKEKPMSWKTMLKALFPKAEKAIEAIPDADLAQEGGPAASGITFSEAEVQAREAAAAKTAEEKGKKAAEAEFAEKERVKALDARKAGISAWCEAKVKEGRLTPAIRAYVEPVLAALAESQAIEFGESKEKLTPFQLVQRLFEAELPKLVTFGEVAGRDRDVGGGDAGKRLAAIAKEKREKDPKLSFSESLIAAQIENPDLARECAENTRG